MCILLSQKSCCQKVAADAVWILRSKGRT